MNKKEIVVPLLVIGLTILFAGICAAVFLSNGKSKKWISRKMKIGGLLLTLTAASCNGGGGEVMCYETVATNSIWIEGTGQNGIEIKLDTSNVLSGQISGLDGTDFSFKISDSENKPLQRGNLIPNDGKFDQFYEAFKIELDKNLQPGNYLLDIFAAKIAAQDTVLAQNHLNLSIKNE
ncbi:MAG: hypothetical protein P1P88_21710 [Bacteroidales bacterium]|nr:hypothetical protein [Bacteroidales bacterium]